jgi:hypothetical protein
MTLIVVERAFAAPREYSELQAREQSAAFCLDTHRVKSLRSFLAFDRRHMLSLYEAPDAEAVRTTQRAAELPVEHVWAATVIVERSTPVPPGYSLVVAQRAMPPGVTPELVQEGLARSTGCNDRLRLTHHAAYISLDCRRMCCIYYSPDVESVRVTSRENSVPLERAWSAERFVCAD